MRDSDVEFYCYFAYIGPFWFVGMMSDRRRERKLKFHLNQGLVLFLFEVAACILGALVWYLMRLIPTFGVYLCWALWLALFAMAFYLSVKGMMTVAADTKERLPVIGRIKLYK